MSNDLDKNPLRVACLGMGWWSDVLADAMQRTNKIKIVSNFTRSEDKRQAFADKYGCTPANSYEDVLKDIYKWLFPKPYPGLGKY